MWGVVRVHRLGYRYAAEMCFLPGMASVGGQRVGVCLGVVGLVRGIVLGVLLMV